jgi:hypothetical protein
MSDWKVPPAQPEGIHWKVVIGAIVGTLSLFTFAVFVVWAIQRVLPREIDPRGASIPAALHQTRINVLRTTPFPIATSAYQKQQDERERLAGYGWVARNEGLIHIPVNQAIADLLAHPPGSPDGGR